MRRQFTLQLHDVPPGRVFTCPTCNAASFHPSNVLQVVCKACSPFLEVRKSQNGIVAVCRWATANVVLESSVEAVDWCNGDIAPAPLPGMPGVVLQSLVEHFVKSDAEVHIVVPGPTFNGQPISQDAHDALSQAFSGRLKPAVDP